jgi:amino-acid N-acetyltransferase
LSNLFIRKAIIADIKHIHKLLNHYADRGLLCLVRSVNSTITCAILTCSWKTGKPEKILGACALGICWEDLAEIRSLAVIEDRQGSDYGRQLVEAC